MRLPLPLAAAALAACSTNVNHVNPYDAATPAGQQARATLVGHVSVEQPPGLVADESGVTVLLVGEGSTATTDKTGLFTLGGVPPGSYVVSLTKPSYDPVRSPPVEVTLASAALPSIDLGTFSLSLSRGGVIGTVTAPGAGTSAGTLVVLSGASIATVTDADGKFELDRVPVGTYTVTATRAGYLDFTSPTFTVTPGQTSALAAVTLNAAPLTVDMRAAITGTCTAAGAPTQGGSTVALSGTDFNGKPFTAPDVTTADDGTFTMSLLPAGSYTVTCSRGESFTVASAGPIALTAGQEASGVALQIDIATGGLTGSVVLDAGLAAGFSPEADLSGIAVTLSGPVTDLPSPLVTLTVAGGGFEFSRVPLSLSGLTNPYTVTAARAGYVPASTAVSVAANQVTALAAPLGLSPVIVTVAGNVTVDGAGGVNAGVIGTLAGLAFNGSSFTSTSAPTPASGDFAFTNVPAGNYVVTLVGNSSYLPTTLASVPVALGSAPPQLTATLYRGAATLSGTVQPDAGGTALVAGATDAASVLVTLQSDPSLSGTFSALTDSSGRFTIRGIPLPLTPTHQYSLVATKSGYLDSAPVGVVLLPDGTTGVNVALHAAGATVSGTVTVADAADSSGVTAALSGQAFNGSTYSATAAATPASGAFAFPNVPAGTYSVTLTGNTSYQPATLTPVTVAPGVAPATLTATLTRGTATLSGAVAPDAGATTLAVSAADAAGALVTLQSDESLSGTFSAVTDSSGRFTIRSVPLPIVPTHAYSLIASKAGYLDSAPTSAVLAPAGTAGVTIALHAAGSALSGSVTVADAADSSGVTATLSGQAFNGAPFALTATPAPTAAAGTYAFANVPAGGSYSVTLSGNTSYGPVTLPAVAVSPGAAVTLPPATLKRLTASYAGVVVPDPGTTQSNAQITIAPTDAANVTVYLQSDPALSATYSTVTDASGNFTLAGVPLPVAPTHPYNLIATKPGFADSTPLPSVLAPGGTVGLTIALHAHANTLTGCARLPFPSPANAATSFTATLQGAAFNGSGVQMQVHAATDTASQCPAGGSQPYAVYSFAHAPDGVYTIQLAARGFGPTTLSDVVAPLAVPLPNTDIVRSVGTINGNVALDPNGTPLSFGPSDDVGVQLTVTSGQPSAPCGVPINGGGGNTGTDELAGTGAWTAVTDADGRFQIASIPVNVDNGYTVTACKAGFFAGEANLDFNGGTSAQVTNLPLKAETGNATVQAEVIDGVGGVFTPQDVSVDVTLSGTAFNGATVGPITLPTPTMATVSGTSAQPYQVTFTPLPFGTYQVSATYAGHVSCIPGNCSNGVCCPSGSAYTGLSLPAGNGNLNLGGMAITMRSATPPSAPVFALATPDGTGRALASPTSWSQAYLQLVTPSVAPAGNLRDYVVSICNSVTTPACSSGNGSWNGAPGSATNYGGVVSFYDSPPALAQSGVYTINVHGEDWLGNEGPDASVVIHHEDRIPGVVQNVHVDNRPGAARISWDPLTSTTSLPVAGYRVQYGPVIGTWAGDFLAQGPSPIDAGAATEVLLTGLTNGATFYVEVDPYDSAVSGPATSTVPNTGYSAPAVVSPSATPFDLGSRTVLDPNPNSLAVQRDVAFVSYGTAAPYTVKAYTYDRYGTELSAGSTNGMTRHGSVSSQRAKQLVPDGNELVYGFDPAQPGVDVIESGNPAAPTVLGSYFVSNGYQLDHLLPMHRSSTTLTAGTNLSHGLITYNATTTPTMQTFHYSGADRRQLVADGNPRALANGKPLLSVQAAGQYAVALEDPGFTSTPCTIDVYAITPTFASINAPVTAVAPAGVQCYSGTMTLDWPNVYMVCGGGLSLCRTTISTSPSLSVGPIVQVTGVSFNNAVTRLGMAGDLLLAGEHANDDVTLVEALSVDDPTALQIVGGYQVGQPYELGNVEVDDLELSGTNVYSLVRGTANVVEILELGGPRSMVKVADSRSLLGGATSYATRIRGTHALAVTYFNGVGYKLVDVDLRKQLGAGTVFTESGVAPYSAQYLAVDGDYAYLGLGTSAASSIAIFDVATGLAADASPLGSVTPASELTGLAVANDLLIATESGSPYLEAWSLADRSSPTKVGALVPGAVSGTLPGDSVDIQGRYAYVGLNYGSTGYGALCVLDVFAGGTGAPVEKSCVVTPAVPALTVAAGAVITTDGSNTERVFSFDPSNPTTAPSLETSYVLIGTSLAELVRDGPYLLQAAPFGLVGFDLGGLVLSPLVDPTLVGALATSPSYDNSSFGFSGSLVAMPDNDGIVFARMY